MRSHGMSSFPACQTRPKPRISETLPPARTRGCHMLARSIRMICASNTPHTVIGESSELRCATRDRPDVVGLFAARHMSDLY